MRLRLTKHIAPLLAAIIVMTAISCSTEKNTAQSRWWHSFTARYNTYYNGSVAYIEGSLEKIRSAREYAKTIGKPELDIEVDGGINAKTAPLVIDAGANVLVAGSALFSAPDFAAATRELRGQ